MTNVNLFVNEPAQRDHALRFVLLGLNGRAYRSASEYTFLCYTVLLYRTYFIGMNYAPC